MNLRETGIFEAGHAARTMVILAAVLLLAGQSVCLTHAHCIPEGCEEREHSGHSDHGGTDVHDHSVLEFTSPRVKTSSADEIFIEEISRENPVVLSGDRLPRLQDSSAERPAAVLTVTARGPPTI